MKEQKTENRIWFRQKKSLFWNSVLCCIPAMAVAVIVLILAYNPHLTEQKDVSGYMGTEAEDINETSEEAAMMNTSPDLVILGDSIMGKERDTTTVPSVISEITGLSIYNAAFGGSCASSNNFDNRYSFHEDSLNLCMLQDAIVQQDFGVQFADLPNNPYQADYFPKTLQGLSEIDFSKVKVLVIEHGTNDYTAGRVLDNAEDPEDIYTFGGALRLTITNLQEAYPQLKIVLVTPDFCWVSGYDDCTVQDFGHGTMEDYVDLELDIADAYGIDVIDVFHNVGFNADNIIGYTEDGLHLNEEGRTIYGTYIGEQLNALLEQ